MGRVLRFEEVPESFFFLDDAEEEIKNYVVDFLLNYAHALGVNDIDCEMAQEWATELMLFLEGEE